jgi:hypothetical protein
MIVEAAIEPYMRCAALLIRASAKATPDTGAALPVRFADAAGKPSL